jgi:hypothetical protein
MHKIFSVFTSRCLVAASNGGTTRPRIRALARTSQKMSLPLLRVLSLPGTQRVHSSVLQQRLLYSRLFTQLFLGNGSKCHNIYDFIL